jgi:cystathionine beta-lyase/cystathionine gamma-synthase
MSDERSSDESICARGGWYPEFTTRPSAPAIWQTTAFDIDGLSQLDAVSTGREKGYIYTRDGNPNHEAFGHDIAQLERAESACVAASGMGAMAAALLGHVQSGDHIVAARVLYGRTSQLLNHLRDAFHVETTYVDAMQPDEVRRAIRSNTKLCIVEAISNPLMEVADLPRLAEAAGSVPILVDGTFATPCLLRPIEHGAKLVFHSASKYLNGHGDVMLGVVVGSHEAMRRTRGIASLYGMNANPFECWLASRGLRTLPLRMRHVSDTALELARFLKAQPGIARVFYPGLEDHSSHDIARRILPNGFGGMLAFDLPGGKPAVESLFKALGHTIPFAPTLADPRTTVSYPTGTSHKFITAAERAALGITDGLVRVSVGLETFADLKREFAAALLAVR